MLLSHEIHYEVEGGAEVLTLLNAFATSLGWTADVWDGTSLQLYSPGYSNQNLVYRLQTSNYDVQADLIRYKGVAPSGRLNPFSLITTDCFGPNSTHTLTTYSTVSVPTSPFTVYLFGTKTFLGLVLNVTPTLVFTMCFGLPNLFTGWRGYVDGLACTWSPLFSSSLTTWLWYNAEDNLTPIYFPLTRGGATTGENVIYLNGVGGVGSTHYKINYTAEYDDNPSTSNIGGNFNKLSYFLNYNVFSGRRSASYITMFVKHNTSALWYPLGLSPVALTHGYGLQIGQEILFGSEKYLAFPIVHYQYKIWQLWRIE